MSNFTEHVLTYGRRKLDIPWFLLACAVAAGSVAWYVAHLPDEAVPLTHAGPPAEAHVMAE